MSTLFATSPASCYHGGAFFDAIGAEFDGLHRRSAIINADVLDAWFDPAPGVIEAVSAHLAWSLRTSPPTHCEGLQRVAGAARGVPDECVLPGGGSSALIFLALREWLDPSSRVLILDPMYGEYAHVLERVIGCQVARLRLHRAERYALDPARLVCELQQGYDLVAIVNPNSPTGQHVPADALRAVLQMAPSSTRIWIDETYLEYVGSSQSLERWAAASRNAVVCKSMSKAYALSGARCAYLCGAVELIGELRRISPPWAIGLPAQIAACEALRSEAYYREQWSATHQLRATLAVRLQQLDWDVVPGCANFLLCHLPRVAGTAAELIAACRERGLFLRDVSSMGTTFDARALRISVKDAGTNERMLNIIGSVSRL